MTSPLFRKTARAQDEAVLTAVSVPRVPTEPDDSIWDQAQPLTIALHPQVLVLPRITEAGAKDLYFRALYDSERIAFLLEWRDAHKDVDPGYREPV